MRRILLFTFVLGCLTDEVSYSPEQDSEAFTAIARTWSGDFTLSLCEDLAAVEDENDCQVDHVVRGDGRGKRHEGSRGGGGCGGCPFGNVAYVKGTVTRDGVPAEVTGEVNLAYGSPDKDPYAYPYSVRLRCTSTETPCVIEARLLETGTIEVMSEGDYTKVASTLTPTGVASCP